MIASRNWVSLSAFLALAGYALGSSVNDCANTCTWVAATQAGCAGMDVHCACTTAEFQAGYRACIESSCSFTEAAEGLQFFSELCQPTDLNGYHYDKSQHVVTEHEHGHGHHGHHGHHDRHLHRRDSSDKGASDSGSSAPAPASTSASATPTTSAPSQSSAAASSSPSGAPSSAAGSTTSASSASASASAKPSGASSASASKGSSASGGSSVKPASSSAGNSSKPSASPAPSNKPSNGGSSQAQPSLTTQTSVSPAPASSTTESSIPVVTPLSGVTLSLPPSLNPSAPAASSGANGNESPSNTVPAISVQTSPFETGTSGAMGLRPVNFPFQAVVVALGGVLAGVVFI